MMESAMDSGQDYGSLARAFHKNLSYRWRDRIKGIDFKWTQVSEWESWIGEEGIARFEIVALDGRTLIQTLWAAKETWMNEPYDCFFEKHFPWFDARFNEFLWKGFEELIAAGEIE